MAKAFDQLVGQRASGSKTKITALSSVVMGNVTIHASAIGFMSCQLVDLLTMPIPKIAPTRMCVLDTGRPNVDATKTTEAALNSALKPDAGCILVLGRYI